MITILKKWEGKFEIDGKIYDNLDDISYKDGEEFEIKLVPESEDKND